MEYSRDMEYSQMNVQQRAEYLLSKRVEATLDIDPDKLELSYTAHVIGVGKLPCGYFDGEQAAIDAGYAFLRAKAAPCNHDWQLWPVADEGWYCLKCHERRYCWLMP